MSLMPRREGLGRVAREAIGQAVRQARGIPGAVALVAALCVPFVQAQPAGERLGRSPEEGVPSELLEIAARIAGSVSDNGLSSFGGARYPLYVAQAGSAEAHTIESPDDFPPAGESLRLEATDVRARLMPAGALLSFAVKGSGGSVPCFALLTRSGLPTGEAGQLGWEVRVLCTGTPDLLVTQPTAAVQVLVDRFAESYVAGDVRVFAGCGLPLLVVDGDRGEATARDDLQAAPLAGHAGTVEGLEVTLSGDVGAVSFTLPRDDGPIAAVMLISLVDGRWRAPAVCIGRSLGATVGAPGVPGDAVLVDGVPLLLGQDVSDCAALFGYALNIRLSHEDREALQRALVTDFEAADEEQRNGLLAVCRAWRQVEEMPPSSRWQVRRRLLDDLLAGAQGRRGLRTTELFTSWHERTLDLLVPGPSPLTRDAAESYVHLLGAVSSVPIEGSLAMPEQLQRDLIAELARVYPRMSDEDKRLVSESVYTWARLQMLWQSADTAAREGLADSLRSNRRAAAERARKGGAYAPVEAIGRTDGQRMTELLDRLFPAEPQKAEAVADLQAEADRAEREHRNEEAALLRQTGHELVRNLVEQMGGEPGSGGAPH